MTRSLEEAQHFPAEVESRVTRHTLYRLFDGNGDLLYVGISNNPFSRVGDHLRGRTWGRLVRDITLEHFDSRKALREAEARAIILELPEYNRAIPANAEAIDADAWESGEFVLEEYEGEYVELTSEERDLVVAAQRNWFGGA